MTPTDEQVARALTDALDNYARLIAACGIRDENPHALCLAKARAALSAMEAEIKRLREALLNTGAHNNPPCAICGYNGPNYYQPETHSCMAKARAALAGDAG